MLRNKIKNNQVIIRQEYPEASNDFDSQKDESQPIEIINNDKTKSNTISKEQKRKWIDEDDDLIKDLIETEPTWSTKCMNKKPIFDCGSNDEDDENEDIYFRTGKYITNSKQLASTIIDTAVCSNINTGTVSKCKLRSLKFLKRAQVALFAGTDSKLHIHQIDCKENPKIQTITFENFPIFCSDFSADGNQIFVGSMYPSIISYDMNSGKIKKHFLKGIEVSNTKQFEVSPDGKYIALIGKYGFIHILSSKTIELIQSLKVEGSNVEAIAFSNDSNLLISFGSNGLVNVWDMNLMRCSHRFYDEGCTKGSSIVFSPKGKYIATGSESGIVNIYNSSCLYPNSFQGSSFQIAQPKPLKAIPNLTNPCTLLRFNSTEEILAMGSNFATNAFKMLHVPTLSVFSNFPSQEKNLFIPYSFDFSPNSGYFSIGNNKGEAILYRLKHYKNY